MAEAVTELARAGRRFRWQRPRSTWLLAPIVGISLLATLGAIRNTSTTFDEILMPAAGARGYATGAFDLVLDHPPLMQYVYGLPVFLARPTYPDEAAGWSYGRRFAYAGTFFWGVGNDGPRLALLARLMAAGIGVLLVLAVFRFARPRFGAAAALLAAGLVAFLPDVVAHAGVAYNDVPLALTYLLAAWALDGALRDPRPARVILAALACAVALGVKFSAIALGPVALVLAGFEGVARRGDRTWLRAMTLGIPLFVLVLYLGTVAVHLGDFALRDFRFGLASNLGHVRGGHGAFPDYFLGESRVGGFWYFYPLAFLFKTPVALQILLLLALLGYVRGRAHSRPRPADLLRSPLRVPLVAGAAFLVALLAANLNIGFRHALPLLPMVCLLVAVEVARLIAGAERPLRIGIAVLCLWYAASTLSYYPHFLAYTSELGPGRDRGHLLFSDSSLDWGQGLVALRDYMRAERIDRIFLGYFGTAAPQAYGIDFVGAASFPGLPPTDPRPTPRFIAISATNLVGNYLPGDPYARFRDVAPDAVLAHSIFVYRLDR